ncbi:hypothetical protein [Nocardia jejuensis]|uniref:hypothetical protein n=1 Tax=Nocardia jejuensis TaxID=328049 RepID=UPI00082DAD06|nr:hypothetical protein [Nocardia jejuensis]
MSDNTVGSAYAVVVTSVTDPMQVEGLEWERAVEFLPSIASQAMQSWVRAQEDGQTAHGVVIPGPHRRVEPDQPYREVCVPSAEYHLFNDAVRSRPVHSLEAARREEDSRRRALLGTPR